MFIQIFVFCAGDHGEKVYEYLVNQSKWNVEKNGKKSNASSASGGETKKWGPKIMIIRDKYCMTAGEALRTIHERVGITITTTTTTITTTTASTVTITTINTTTTTTIVVVH